MTVILTQCARTSSHDDIVFTPNLICSINNNISENTGAMIAVLVSCTRGFDDAEDIMTICYHLVFCIVPTFSTNFGSSGECNE